MATYDKDLNQGKDGAWSRWIGTDTEGSKQKFRLGKDKTEAARRLKLILALYEITSAWTEGKGWTPEHLAAAKAIAKGGKAVFPPFRMAIPGRTEFFEQNGEEYAQALYVVNKVYGGEFEADPRIASAAIRSIEGKQSSTRLAKSALTGADNEREPTGQTVRKALEAHIASIRKDYAIPGGGLTPWGKTQCDQLKSWIDYMGKKAGLLDTDLADLTIAKAQEMINAIRLRPLTIRSGETKRMTCKTAGAYLKTVRGFWDWLDLADEWEWNEPPRFRKLDYTVSSLTDEEKHQKELAKDKWEISNDEIRTLFAHATSKERVLLLLGLNCAFGPGEVGNLRLPYLKLETKEIDGIRFKTGNKTRHHLWPETCVALSGELLRRHSINKSTAEDVVFLTDSGGRLWKKTLGGNYVDNVSKRWNDLIKRVRKHHPNFHRYSFGKLRKTAAIRILNLAGVPQASLILAHGSSISDDKLLLAYVTLPWQQLYEAQRAYGESVRPFIVPSQHMSKDYIGGKAAQIVEKWKSGTRAEQIAQEVGVSPMTVYRHVDRAGLRE